MNLIKVLPSDYIRPSRTIETIQITSQHKSCIYFLYNHDGLYFYLFSSLLAVIQYFKSGSNTDNQDYVLFETECELDAYLERVEVF